MLTDVEFFFHINWLSYSKCYLITPFLFPFLVEQEAAFKELDTNCDDKFELWIIEREVTISVIKWIFENQLALWFSCGWIEIC